MLEQRFAESLLPLSWPAMLFTSFTLQDSSDMKTCASVSVHCFLMPSCRPFFATQTGTLPTSPGTDRCFARPSDFRCSQQGERGSCQSTPAKVPWPPELIDNLATALEELLTLRAKKDLELRVRSGRRKSHACLSPQQKNDRRFADLFAPRFPLHLTLPMICEPYFSNLSVWSWVREVTKATATSGAVTFFDA